MRLILPLVLGLVGLGAGVGAGLYLQPPPAPEAMVEHDPAEADGDVVLARAAAEAHEEDAATYDYMRLNNQFVVPVVGEGRVTSLVILSLSLEIDPGGTEAVYAREPKLRDGFLQVLFDHANAGGFDGDFTAPTKRMALRRALSEQASKILGPLVNDVLIVDMVRQDN